MVAPAMGPHPPTPAAPPIKPITLAPPTTAPLPAPVQKGTVAGTITIAPFHAPAVPPVTPPAPLPPTMKKGPLASQARNILHERPGYEHPQLVQAGQAYVPPAAKHVPINIRSKGAPVRFSARSVIRGGKRVVLRFNAPRFPILVHLRADATGNTTQGATVRFGDGLVAFGPGENGTREVTGAAPSGKPIVVNIDTKGVGSVVIVLTGQTEPIQITQPVEPQHKTQPQAPTSPQADASRPQAQGFTRFGANLAAALQSGMPGGFVGGWKEWLKQHKPAPLDADKVGAEVFKGAKGPRGERGSAGPAGLDRNQYSPGGRADAASRTFWQSYAEAVAKGLPASQAAAQMADHAIPPLDTYVQGRWPAAIAGILRELKKLGLKVQGAEGAKGAAGATGAAGPEASPENVRRVFDAVTARVSNIPGLTFQERINLIMREMGGVFPELGTPGAEPPPGAGPMGPPRPFIETPFRPGTERNQYGPGDPFAGTELGLSPEEQAAEDKAKADAEAAAARKTAPVPLEKLKTALQHWIELRNKLAGMPPGSTLPMQGPGGTQINWSRTDFDNKIAQLVGMIESAETEAQQQKKEEDMAALVAWAKKPSDFVLPKGLAMLIGMTIDNGDAERAAALLAYGRRVMAAGREAERQRFESQVKWANDHGGSAAGWIDPMDQHF